MKGPYECAEEAEHWLGLAQAVTKDPPQREALAAIGHGYATLAVAGELRAIRELLTPPTGSDDAR